MTSYTDRAGQKIGPWTVQGDYGRTKAGKVLWKIQHDDGTVKVLRTERLIALDRAYGGTGPTG